MCVLQDNEKLIKKCKILNLFVFFKKLTLTVHIANLIVRAVYEI